MLKPSIRALYSQSTKRFHTPSVPSRSASRLSFQAASQNSHVTPQSTASSPSPFPSKPSQTSQFPSPSSANSQVDPKQILADISSHGTPQSSQPRSYQQFQPLKQPPKYPPQRQTNVPYTELQHQNNNSQTTTLDSNDEIIQPTYPTLSPEPPFSPRTRFTNENVVKELYHYANTNNTAGVRAAHNYLRTKRLGTVTTYNCVISHFVQARDNASVAKALTEMKSDAIEQNSATLNMLLNHACNRGNQTDFDQILAAMHKTGIPRAYVVSVFNVRLKNAAARNNRAQIAAILEEMHKGGHAPDEYTYYHVLRYHATRKDLAQCLSVLDEMRAANIELRDTVFDTVFDACTNDAQVQQVQDLMKKLGLHLSLKVYNTRINVAAKQEDFARCRELLRDMERAGVAPDAVSYTTIIQGLCKKRAMQECNEMLKEMISKGVNPEVSTYTILATGWATHGYFAQALELVGVMRAKHLPIKHAVTSIIYQMILNGQVEQGLKLFEQVVAEGNAAVETYNSVIYSLLDQRAMQACEQVYAIMRERGVQPDHVTYQALVILAVRNQSDVLVLRDQMRADNVEPNEGMFNALLRQSRGPVQREVELLSEMRAKGYQPEEAVILKVMRAAAYTGDAQTSAKLVADVRAHGDVLSSQLYHFLTVAYVLANDDAQVWKTVAEMRELKLGPTDETYKVLLDYLQKGKNWEKCVELLEEMETNHIMPVGLWQQ